MNPLWLLDLDIPIHMLERTYLGGRRYFARVYTFPRRDRTPFMLRWVLSADSRNMLFTRGCNACSCSIAICGTQLQDRKNVLVRMFIVAMVYVFSLRENVLYFMYIFWSVREALLLSQRVADGYFKGNIAARIA